MDSITIVPLGVTMASILPSAVKHNSAPSLRTMIHLGEPIPFGEKLPNAQPAIHETLAELPPEHVPVEMHQSMELAGVRTAGPS